MGNSRDQRRAKKIAKQKKTRAAAQAKRATRTVGGKPSALKASQWPTADCWLSESWHEAGEPVSAVFVRAHDDGAHAYAAFTVDLSDGRVTEADVQLPVTSNHAMQAVVNRAEHGHMSQVSPESVVQLLQEALDFAQPGTAHAKGLQKVLDLMGDTSRDGDLSLRFGAPEDFEVTEAPKKKGLLSRLFG